MQAGAEIQAHRGNGENGLHKKVQTGAEMAGDHQEASKAIICPSCTFCGLVIS